MNTQARPASAWAHAEVPLCVDLDGTLVRTDTLAESAARFVAERPLEAWRLAAWLARGRAHLKRELAFAVPVDASALPYDEAIVERLRREREAGRRIVLATAADGTTADRVAAHLGLFDEVVASDGTLNLRGERKRDALVARYARFDYIGDGAADAPVRAAAREAVDPTRPFSWGAFARALRPHQWLKNLLIFLPLLLSHRVYDSAAIVRDVAAVVAFSLCASAIYLINDVIDLPNDRAHRSKRRRPIAAGDMSIKAALVAAPLLAALSLALAFAISPAFALVVVGYLALTLAYSLELKRIVLLDVVVLAALYASRLLAGSVAAGVVASFWLMAFALFMFASLAMLKRYSELVALRGSRTAAVAGRGYTAADLEMIGSFGVGAGYVAVLVVALYIHGDLVRSLYAHPQLLWLLCPILLYWISRTWLIAHRGGMDDDPILFALRDRTSQLVAALCLLVGILATLKVPIPH